MENQATSEQEAHFNSTQELEQEKSLLTMNDLKNINNNSLGLRHVSSAVKANKELENGIIEGDALALASIKELLPSEFKNVFLSFKDIILTLSDEQQEALIDDFLSAVKSFIEDSVGMDINLVINDGDTVQNLIDSLNKKGLVFLTATFSNANYGYDAGSYYNLGKCGKQTVKSEDIKGAIFLTIEDIDMLELENKDQLVKKTQFESIKSALSNILFSKFIHQIQKFRS